MGTREEIDALRLERSEARQQLEAVRLANGNASAEKRLKDLNAQLVAAEARIAAADKRDAESLQLHKSFEVREEALRERERVCAEKDKEIARFKAWAAERRQEAAA